jgi:hypothetical protein
MICYVITHGSVIINLLVHTYHVILYHNYLPCIYVLPEDGRHRPNHVGEIAKKIQLSMHDYLPLVRINTMSSIVQHVT